MRRGFLYLVANVDWSTRKMLSWRLSNTIAERSHGVMSAKPTGDVEFCIEALEEALKRFGRPEIFNTDQRGQFTSPRFLAREIFGYLCRMPRAKSVAPVAG